MQRHEALQDLSRDHHHGLVWAQRLEEAGDPQGERDPDGTAEAFASFWEDELADHFTEEELVLLPVYQRHADLREDELVLAMVADHAWFRDAVPGLGGREGDELSARLRELGDRLEAHARMEDRELFPRIEEALSEDELALVHERSMRFRREHRGEDAIGPRPTREG